MMITINPVSVFSNVVVIIVVEIFTQLLFLHSSLYRKQSSQQFIQSKV